MSEQKNTKKENPTSTFDKPEEQVNLAHLLSQAFALHQQSEFTNASTIYKKILEIQPDNFNVLYLFGILKIQIEEFTNAVDLLSKALKVNPSHWECHYNCGIALAAVKRFEEALLSYDQAINLHAGDAETHLNRGIVLAELKRFEEALLSYDQAINLHAYFAKAQFNRGIVLLELKRFEEALLSLDQAINLQANDAEAHLNRGIVLAELKQLEEALLSCDQAIKLQGEFPEAHYNRGIVLGKLNQFEEALLSFDKAINLQADFAETHYNRGIALGELKRFEEALLSYDQAIKLRTDYAEARFNSSIINLLLGNLIYGWRDYEWRWKSNEIAKTCGGARNFSEPLWLGITPIKDKTILVYAEQGFGDTIQFSRYVSLLSKLGANVILEVQPQLVKLLSPMTEAVSVIAKGEKLPKFDFQCPLLSLPLAFKTELHSIPSPLGEVIANKTKISKLELKLGKKTTPRVGIVWSGSTINKNGSNRSLTLSQILPYLSTNLEYFCLQKEVRDIDKMLLAQQTQIKYFGDTLDDFTDTAALCELMDVVITVDTSVAHLAASLEKPTWILLPFIPDWRWGLDRDDSPWYPSARLYRQESRGDWTAPLDNIKNELKKLSSLKYCC